MKPKHYREKYNLESSDRFHHDDFVADFKVDFDSVSMNKPTISQVENLIKQTKNKFDQIFINSKVDVERQDKLWKYIFATIIAPYRDLHCPQYKETKKKEYDEREEKRRRWREREQWYRNSFYENTFNESFQSRFRSFLKSLMNDDREDWAKSTLQIEDAELTYDLIKSQYRTLSKLHHSDVGGNDETFIRLTEAKDYLMSITLA